MLADCAGRPFGPDVGPHERIASRASLGQANGYLGASWSDDSSSFSQF